LLGLALPKDTPDIWLEDFARGLELATQHFHCPLLGGDTISGVEQITLSLTAFGTVLPGKAMDRRAAKAGDLLVLSGTAGDAGLALRQIQAGNPVPDALMARYQRPEPRLALGQALADIARACADVSDGVLKDAHNIAEASGLAIRIDIDALPLSDDYLQLSNDRLFAATSGDDYELLFTISPENQGALLRLSQSLDITLTVIGECMIHHPQMRRLTVVRADGEDVTPVTLGFEH
jgi:thiamine-monophosphate kinase